MGFPMQAKRLIGLLENGLFTHVSKAPKLSFWFLNMAILREVWIFWRSSNSKLGHFGSQVRLVNLWKSHAIENNNHKSLAFRQECPNINDTTVGQAIIMFPKSYHLLFISTSFWVLRAPKSWLKYFFELFSTFFLDFKKFFSYFSSEMKKKHLKNCVLSYSLKLVDM